MLESMRTSAGATISIHALCEEGDFTLEALILCDGISIHALCEEGDPESASSTV